MSRQQISIQHSALGWVKKGIDDNLSEINVDLKRYIEDDDISLLESIRERLATVQGVLMMVEQYGAAMLTEEMESLCSFIIENRQEKGDQALEVMLRAVLQLPDYLEHIQSGHRDIPIAILPLLNDIRAVKNQDLFSEKLLFLPDLSMHQSGADTEAIDARHNHASKQYAKKLRPIYQFALVKVITEKAVEENLKRLEKVCETFEEKSFSEQAARIWWIIGALIESVSRQQLELGASIKSLLGKVDALFRVILIIGEQGLLNRQPIDLIKNFLYYIAQPECDGPKAQAIKTAYRLEQFLPSEAARSRVLDNIAGPNQALLKTVGEAMKTDIEAVKSTLEVYVNGDLADTDKLKDIPQELHVISDTLAMLGLGQQRQMIEAQIGVIKEVVEGNQLSSEAELLSMASELLQVEHALDQMQRRQPASIEEDSRSEKDASRDYELDNVLTAVVTAALDDIQKTKSAILEFVKDSTRVENIELCVELMQESRGALELLNQPRAVAVVDGLLQYLQDYDIVEFMDSVRLDSLSQVVVSLEYYLEAIGEHRGDTAEILDFADTQLQALLKSAAQRAAHDGGEIELTVDDDSDEIADTPDDIVSDISEDLEDLHAVLDVEEVAEQELEAAEPEPLEEVVEVEEVESSSTADGELNVQPVNETLEVLQPGSDPDILEIYLEEAEEESENIIRLQQDWMLHPEDQNALKNIRRAFHTIKGSGRLVGAIKIGEFAWDFEQLLNRVIDRTVPPNDAIINAVGQAGVASLELVNELKTSEPPASDIAYLRGLARALAAFDADQVRIERTGIMQVVESPYDRITDGTDPEIEAVDPDEALLSEPETMSLQADDFEGMDSPEFDSESDYLIDNGDFNADLDDNLPELDYEEIAVDNAEETPPDPLAETTRVNMPGAGAGTTEGEIQEPVESTGLSIDPQLLTIYQQEVEQHLSIVNSALESAAHTDELVPTEAVYRALHTINGASRTADIRSIGELAALMEKPLKAVLSQSMALDREILGLYRLGYRAISYMTKELVETRQLPEIPEDLKSRLLALAEDLEEHTVEIPDDIEQPTSEFIDTLNMLNDASDDSDNELLSIFIEEAKELLEMSDHALHNWADQEADEHGNYDSAPVMELQRYLHTLKGGAKMAELIPISDLSHELESMFIAIIENRVEINEDLVDLLKDSFDLLHNQVGESERNQSLSDSSDSVKKLKSMRRGGNKQQEVSSEKDEAAANPVSEIEPEISSEEPDQVPGRRSQDVVRVRSDLLDNLVNSAGEVSIYRARMEQQVAGLGSHLGELGQTIMRLKNQLRSLEAETDAQIHFSHQSLTSKEEEFDPLEMDRYTLIQELSRALSESVNDLSSLQGMLGEQVKDSETLLLQQSRVNTDLQDGLIKSRMVKFSGLFSRLRRLVRQSSQEVAKKAELVISGEDNEVDNKVLDRMVAPLEHIIRNAVSHGIEPPVERVRKGKPETGEIKIDISRDGSDVVIRVSDDGAGVDLEKVRNKAEKMGLIEKDQSITDGDLVQYILEPGFSTASQITQLSGRGVGMDVVDIEIKQLGGTLQIESTPQGTTFIARLPFTLSINQAILVKTGEEIYAIPLINIEGITRLETDKLVEYYQSENAELDFAGQKFGLHYLSHLVGAGVQIDAEDSQSKQPVILIRSGDIRVALHVDEVLGNREIVVKSLGKQLSQVKGLSGASILADGSVVLILDVNGLVRHSDAAEVKVVYRAEQPESVNTVDLTGNTIMVVDDSITMRRVASKLLERHNYTVVTAKDGVDALAQLEDVRPDLMLLDIEMPRMDGYELASHMQNEDLYSKIPIIMITSRTGEKHRDRALEIGVTNYMGKPYQEEELISNIQQALGA